MVEMMQIVASTDLFHYILLLLDQHCEQFELSDNRHDISWENRLTKIETIAITLLNILIQVYIQVLLLTFHKNAKY